MSDAGAKLIADAIKDMGVSIYLAILVSAFIRAVWNR